MMLLVIVVVGNSQYQQYRLAQTAVDQNQKIIHQVNATIKDLKDAEVSIIMDNRILVHNITGQHQKILTYISNATDKRAAENHDIREILENNTKLLKENSKSLAADLARQHDLLNKKLDALNSSIPRTS
jgi:hypothetical protein